MLESDLLTGSGWEFNELHPPGHFAGHLRFQLQDALFVGDHDMDWSTLKVSPPDRHLGDFIATCEKLISLARRLCLTGHGEPLYDPVERLGWLVAHRTSRETQFLGVLSNSPVSIGEIVAREYPEFPSDVYLAAARNVLAHLVDLWERRLVEPIPRTRRDAKFRLS